MDSAPPKAENISMKYICGGKLLIKFLYLRRSLIHYHFKSSVLSSSLPPSLLTRVRNLVLCWSSQTVAPKARSNPGTQSPVRHADIGILLVASYLKEFPIVDCQGCSLLDQYVLGRLVLISPPYSPVLASKGFSTKNVQRGVRPSLTCGFTKFVWTRPDLFLTLKLLAYGSDPLRRTIIDIGWCRNRGVGNGGWCRDSDLHRSFQIIDVFAFEVHYLAYWVLVMLK